MAYVRRGFTDGQVLKAEDLIHMEDGIISLEDELNSHIGMNVARLGNVILPADSWVGSGNLYYQRPAIDVEITEYSQVNLTPTIEQMATFYEKDITFITENDDGALTVYVIGQKPQNDYTIQASIVEVSV